MSRPVPRLVCLLAICASASLHAAEPKELKAIATFTGPYGPIQLKINDTGAVIRSAEELVAKSSKPDSAKDAAVQKAMADELAKLLRVDAIDWSKQMVLVFKGRPSGDGGGFIKFGNLTVENNVLTVSWQQQDRPSLGIVTPMGTVLVDRFDGEVKFVPVKK